MKSSDLCMPHADRSGCDGSVLPATVSNEFAFSPQKKRTVMPRFDSTRADGELPIQDQPGGGQRNKKSHNDASRHSQEEMLRRSTHGHFCGPLHCTNHFLKLHNLI